jgi:hypothetical protein
MRMPSSRRITGLRPCMSSAPHPSVSNTHRGRPPGMSRVVAGEVTAREVLAAVVDFYP